MAQAIRAFLLASATAATLGCRRSRSLPSQRLLGSCLAAGPAEHGTRTMDHQGAQIAVPSFADAEEALSTATRSLLGHKPEPRRELPAILEAPSITDSSHQRRCAQWADAFDLTETLAQLATTIKLANSPILGCNPAVELGQLHLQLAHESSNQIAEVHRSLLPATSARPCRSLAMLRAMTMPCSLRTPRI